MKFCYPFPFLLLIVSIGFAQNQKYIHQTFAMDTATTLQLDLHGEFTIETWIGDAIMIETKASLYDASEGIFAFLIKEGRYEVEAKLEGNTLLLVSKDKIRRPVGTTKGTSREEVQVKVFIPEKMKSAGTNTWTLPESEQKKDFTKKGDGG